MVAGVALLALIAGVVRGGATSELPWLGIWAFVGPPSVVVAKVLQVRLLARAAGHPDAARPGESGAGGSPLDDSHAGAALTAHIVPWAIVEGPAMLGAVAYLLGAAPAVLVASLLTAAVGFAITAPRRDAFGLR